MWTGRHNVRGAATGTGFVYRHVRSILPKIARPFRQPRVQGDLVPELEIIVTGRITSYAVVPGGTTGTARR